MKGGHVYDAYVKKHTHVVYVQNIYKYSDIYINGTRPIIECKPKPNS
jgi:hypothetical protein